MNIKKIKNIEIFLILRILCLTSSLLHSKIGDDSYCLAWNKKLGGVRGGKCLWDSWLFLFSFFFFLCFLFLYFVFCILFFVFVFFSLSFHSFSFFLEEKARQWVILEDNYIPKFVHEEKRKVREEDLERVKEAVMKAGGKWGGNMFLYISRVDGGKGQVGILCYLLFVICYLLFVICYLLFVICYLLFVICVLFLFFFFCFSPLSSLLPFFFFFPKASFIYQVTRNKDWFRANDISFKFILSLDQHNKV